nr:hypothetical protein [Candidatus Njordarchaeota archaeon]
MEKTARINWSGYVTIGIIDSLVTTLGVLSGITVESSVSGFIVIAGTIAAGSATGVALFFAIYLTTLWESRSDYPFPRMPPPSRPLARGAGTAFSAMATGVLVVLPFLILTVSDAVTISVLGGLASLLLVGWFRGEKNTKRRQRLRSALETVCVGLVAVIIARLLALFIEIVVGA